MTPALSDTVAALWLAVEADPHDAGLRGKLADAYRDDGREDEANAVLATADRVPRWKSGMWSWRRDGDGSQCNQFRIEKTVFGHLESLSESHWRSRWRRYHRAHLAMLDLVRAWVAVHRAGVTH